jgi:hypothetical protein
VRHESRENEAALFIEPLADGLPIRIKRDMDRFPIVPGAGCQQSIFPIASREPSGIGLYDPLPGAPAGGLLKPLPGFGEYVPDAFGDPSDLLTASRRYRDQYQLRDPVRMG